MKTLKAKVTVLPVQCSRCQRYHHVGVRLVREGCADSCTQPGPHDEPELQYELPDNCVCGEPMDTYEHVREVEETVLYIFEHGYPAGAA